MVDPVDPAGPPPMTATSGLPFGSGMFGTVHAPFNAIRFLPTRADAAPREAIRRTFLIRIVSGGPIAAHGTIGLPLQALARAPNQPRLCRCARGGDSPRAGRELSNRAPRVDRAGG